MLRSLLFLVFIPVVAFASEAALPVAFTDAKGQPVEDVVVSLMPLDGQAPATAASTPVEIIQKDQQFLPYVSVVTKGTPVVFPNKDTVQHHVYSLSKPKKFEFPLYDPGKAETIIFDQPGLVTIGCNIHDWMAAYLLVVETPWFAKSNATGTAALSAPAGRYRLEAWHPRLAKPVTQDVTLKPGTNSPLPVSLTLKPDRRIRRSPDGKSSGY